MATGMFDSFITRGWFSPEACALWSDIATLQAWLDVEATLAEAQAELGIVPGECAAVIRSKARAENFDLDRLAAEIAFAQHPFVPVLKQLEELCAEPAAGFIHLGATTQNIFDTAVSLQMRQTHGLIQVGIGQVLGQLRKLAEQHAHTLQAGRTHGQHALPMTFGFKVACWIQEIARDRDRLSERVAKSLVAALGGAIGTGAALNGNSSAVEAGMARRLGLLPAGLACRASNDRLTDYIGSLGLLGATLEKIAMDIVFLQRTEIGEVEEAFHHGKVGSSTMAQKRNPSMSLRLASLGRMLRARLPLCYELMIRMDEGDSAASNVMDVTVPEIAVIASSMVASFAGIAEGLVVHEAAMARNAMATGGLIVAEAVMMRLTRETGRHEAHHIIYDIAQQAQSAGDGFLDALRKSESLRGVSAEQLEQLLDPASYTGQSAEFAMRAAGKVG